MRQTSSLPQLQSLTAERILAETFQNICSEAAWNTSAGEISAQGDEKRLEAGACSGN